MAEFAHIIIDISHEKVDRPFQYRIPEPLKGQIYAGCQVDVPFGKGNQIRKGYVVGLSDQASYDPEKLKEIVGIHAGSISAESQLIQVAWWMKERYGSTMNQALKTVLPVKQKVKQKEKRWICCLLDPEERKAQAAEAIKKKYKARERLFEAFLEMDRIPYEMAQQLNITAAVLKPLIERGMIQVEALADYRNPAAGFLKPQSKASSLVTLNTEQQAVVSDICTEYDSGIRKTYLIHGITGSGKTEIYMELIEHVRNQGKEAILLIPEISLTYQTVMRFCRRFGNKVSFINSKLSAGERYDQFEQAKKGEIQIMIGPRSALFTPFQNLGLIIIDEEHEAAYKSEITPRYHARETAQYRAGLCSASVVLGSATPSVETYTKALHGIYGYYKINRRAKKNSMLPKVWVVDMRKELREGNRSIFSRCLQDLMKEKLEKQEQAILFLNRRGYSSFLSCRNCGEAIKCHHCDVTLTLHQDDRLVCHYCGYQIRRPRLCPVCSSPYLAPFGAGTQKVEAMVQEAFPLARVLRMDYDTTSKKGGHQAILSAFANHEADILVGTQMIVKGHDFPAVTLVGILAADVSLYAPDYRCGERTFQLLTQAAGRAGRDERRGHVVIQTYSPEHYCVETAATQNYEQFYQKEMEYRKLLSYPPACALMALMVSSSNEGVTQNAMEAAFRIAGSFGRRITQGAGICGSEPVKMIGPVNAAIYKLNDMYRKILYMKCENYDILIKIRNHTEEELKQQGFSGQASILFDFM